LHEHLAVCGACRAWVSELARASWLDEAPTRTSEAVAPDEGRYVTLVKLGSGAMGTVWAAYDPELDREVALKVLDVDEPHRLREEARSLAALSHPNVVEVLDIRLDVSPPAIAMELVEGPTLLEWTSMAARSSAEVIRMFMQAGRGLAAAHDAGLVHRDFKPSNVLVGADGRVRVVDFGLAHPQHTDAAHPPRWAGTPAYMAPEQRRGQPPSASADQYAWCVALHEALLGQRPGTAKTSGPAATDPPPKHVLRCLARGLSDDPNARWPSMHALLRAIERGPRVLRRVGGVAVLLGALATVSTFDAAEPPCSGRGAIGLSTWLAAQGESPTHQALAAEVERWEAADRDACDRTPGVDDPCLRRHAAHLRAAALTVAATDPLAAARVVERLPSPQACLSPRVSGRPHDDVLDAAIASATVLADAGRHLEAIERLRTLESRVERLGSAAVRTRFAFAYATAAWAEGRDSTVWFERAARDGTTGGDRHTAARAAIHLAANASPATPIDPERAAAWLERAETLVEADGMDDLERGLLLARGHIALDTGDFDEGIRVLRAAVKHTRTEHDAPWVIAETLESLATALRESGELAEAERVQTEALGLLEASRGKSHPSTALTRAKLAQVWSDAGRIEAARDAYSLSLTQLEAALGPEHLSVAVVATNLATAHLLSGDALPAIALLRRVADIERERLQPGQATAATLHTLGNAYVLQDDLESAAEAFSTGLEHIGRELGDDHPQRAIFLSSLASVALDRGRPDEAITLAEESRAVRAAAFGSDDPRLAFEDLVLAGAYLERGRPELASSTARRGARLLYDDPVRPRWLAELRYFEARALVDLGRTDEAIPVALAGARTFEAAGDDALGSEIRAWARELAASSVP